MYLNNEFGLNDWVEVRKHVKLLFISINKITKYLQNDYDVWQFRIWLADEDKYFRQS